MPTDSLLHIADLHFWECVLNPFRLLNKRFLGNINVWLRRRHEFAMDRAEEFADYAASTGVRHVLLTGDFSSTATDWECGAGAAFVRGLEERGLVPYVLPGNHDVYTFESVRNKRFERHFDAWVPEEGLPATRVLPGGTSLVLVPTVCANWISSKGVITPVEIEGTSERLRRCASPVLVAGHYPLLDETPAYATAPSRRLRNAGSLRNVLGRTRKKTLYICGHVHRFSYTQDDRFEDLDHLSTGAFFRRDEKKGIYGEFAEIHVFGDEFMVYRHVFRNDWSRTKEHVTN